MTERKETLITVKTLITEKGERRIIKDKTLISIDEKERKFDFLVTERDQNRMID